MKNQTRPYNVDAAITILIGTVVIGIVNTLAFSDRLVASILPRGASSEEIAAATVGAIVMNLTTCGLLIIMTILLARRHNWVRWCFAISLPLGFLFQGIALATADKSLLLPNGIGVICGLAQLWATALLFRKSSSDWFTHASKDVISSDSVVALEKLAQLKTQGVISEAEFEEQKRKVLAS